MSDKSGYCKNVFGTPWIIIYTNQSPQRVNLFKYKKSKYIFKAPIFHIPIKQAQLFSDGLGKQSLLTILYSSQVRHSTLDGQYMLHKRKSFNESISTPQPKGTRDMLFNQRVFRLSLSCGFVYLHF